MTTALRLDSVLSLWARAPQLHWASRNRRRHWARDVVRTLLLGMSDLGTVVSVRALIQVVQDHAVLSHGLGVLLSTLMPPGTLGGWQFAVACLVALTITGAYGRGRGRDQGRIIVGVAVAALMMLYPQLWERSADAVAMRLATVIAGFTPALLLSRTLTEKLIGRVVPSLGPSRVVLVSGGASDWIDSALLDSGPDARFHIVATVATNRGSPRRALRELPRVIDDTRADSILLAGPLADRDFAFVADTALASGCRLLAAPRTARVAGVDPRAVWEQGAALVELTAPAGHAWHLAAKRVVDVCLSALALVLLSPVFGILAVLVKLESPGPAIFGHWRLGAGGRMFRCYKFRSMRQHAEQLLQIDPHLYQRYVDNNYKLPPHLDPRLTRIGTLLRKYSLDELPQLFNVLLGDMSLVGPRPIVADELDHYGGTAALLLSRKPGLTSNWAINGRSDVSYPQRADLELAYLRQWSLQNDVRIMLRTVRAVALKRGAY
jgi:lipopolysaccharide/colanic/teichoic acid biosynthesis glycosyltransferase